MPKYSHNINFNFKHSLCIMRVQYYFQKLKDINKVYCVQGKLFYDPLFFYSRNQTAVLSFIIQDIDKKSIECVAFGQEAEKFKKSLDINKIYQINFVTTIKNDKYIKTNHKFKLHLTMDSEIIQLKVQKYLKGKKTCVKPNTKKNNKLNHKNVKLTETSHQSCITNWLVKMK